MFVTLTMISNIRMEKLKMLHYESLLDRCLKKSTLQIICNPTGFVRGVPRQLADDMLILAMDKINKVTDLETLERLKFICTYFISKKSNIRKSYGSPDSDTFIFDKFTSYESQLKDINEKMAYYNSRANYCNSSDR